MIINLLTKDDNFEGETMQEVINQIIDYACSDEFCIPQLTEGYFTLNNKEVEFCQKALDRIQKKIEDKILYAQKEYNESLKEKEELMKDYYNNLV
jgi:hypothetical protein